MAKRFPPISAKLPRLLHGADYNPDQWLHDPQVLSEDIRMMKLAGCNVMALGIFAWSALEPEEGVFTFDWLDDMLDRFAENGLYAWLATPSGARPPWLAEKYPEVLRTGRNRVRNLFGIRHNHCYTSPVYREKTAQINRKLAERYAGHPAVIGWHISNEYGGECHCPLCQDAFREWLAVKYGTLEALNHAWWNAFWSHTYTDWRQIESPAPHDEHIVHAMNIDWKRFVTDRTVDFCRHEIEAVREGCGGRMLPITTNMMDMFEGLDYRKFAELLDVISWDAYPAWHEMADDSLTAVRVSFNHDLFRAMKHRPFVLMESTPSVTNWQPVSKLKRPGMHRLASLQAVAHGADGVQYFQWRKSRGASEKFHGAVVDHAGHEHTRVFREVAEVGDVLSRLQEIVGTDTPAEVAILFDWDNRWAVEGAKGPRNGGLHYEETLLQHYRAFWEHGVSVDIIGADADFSPYRLIVAPMLYMCRPETAGKLERFTYAGGTVVATYWSGVVDENDLCHLGGFPGPLRSLLGVWAEEIDALYDGDTNGVIPEDGNSLGLTAAYEAYELCELAHTEGAKVLAVYRDDFYAGRPALTRNAWGQGAAYYMAARMRDPFLADFYSRVIDEAGIRRALGTKLPEGVTAQLRTDGETEYVFVLNFSGSARVVPLDDRKYVDVLTDEPIEAALLPLGVHDGMVLKKKVD
jgi:beta-galactosidase